VEQYFLRDGIAIGPPRDGWFPVACAVTRAGRLARISSPQDVRALWQARHEALLNRTVKPGEPIIPPDTIAAIDALDGTIAHQGPRFILEALFPKFDQLTDGSWIIADPRCRLSEENARLLGPDGVTLRRFCLGDGISHLQCDGGNRFWVGYFDEGVFGVGSAPPIGAAGLNRFDSDGRIEWQYDAPIIHVPTGNATRAAGERHWYIFGRPPTSRNVQSTVQSRLWIYDCYALNVASDAVWCCPYSDFPILRIDSDEMVQAWQNATRGAHALAAKGDYVLLVGGYNEHASRGVLLNLGNEDTKVVRELQILFPDGTELGRNATVIGRDDVIHCLKDDFWFRLNLRDII
jgi:hypothetical protein